MISPLIDTWFSEEPAVSSFKVMPDGCRDVICSLYHDKPAEWRISPLFDQATDVTTQPAMTVIGFRLVAGVAIDSKTLLPMLANLSDPLNTDQADVEAVISDTCSLSPFLQDAMAVLSGAAVGPVVGVAQVADELGVSMRTLQRHVFKGTRRSPVYWHALSRARRAANRIDGKLPLAAVADDYGYADQAHMCREFRRWFRATPTDFVCSARLRTLVGMPGFGNDPTLNPA